MHAAAALLVLFAAACAGQSCVDDLTIDKLSVTTLKLGADDLDSRLDTMHILPSAGDAQPTRAGQTAFDYTTSRMMVSMPTSAAGTSFAWRDPLEWRCKGGYANGVVESGDECDDGNDTDRDGCHGCVRSKDGIRVVVRGREGVDNTDSGVVSSRSVTLTKAYDQTSVEVTIQELLGLITGASGSQQACRWTVLFNGSPCPSTTIDHVQFLDSGDKTVEHTSQIWGICSGLSAGSVTVTLGVDSSDEIYAPSNCLTGWWGDATFTISAQEVWS